MSTAATLSSRIAPQRDADLLPPTADAPDQVSFKTWVAVVGSTIGAFLAILNIQVVGASLADIQGGIGAGLDDGGWITTSYLVAEIIVIPLSAWLANIFSLRTYLLGSTVVFLGLTAACASAHTLGQMSVIRAAQGFAGGALIPLAFTIIMTKLPRSKHPVGLAVYSIAVVFAPSIGPALGGYFSDTFGWQSIFFLSLPSGLVMVAMLWYALESAPRQWHLLRQGDWLGMFTMAVGLGSGDRARGRQQGRLVRLAVHRAPRCDRRIESRRLYLRGAEARRAAAQSAAAGAPQFWSWHLRELHFRVLDVRLDLPRPAVSVAHAGLQLPTDRRRDDLAWAAATAAHPVYSQGHATRRYAPAGCRRLHAVHRRQPPRHAPVG